MNKYCLVIVFLLFLNGCNSTSSTSFTGPTGQQVHSTKCESATDTCFAEASKICNGSYQVVDSDSHAGGLGTDIMPGVITWYGMSYVCGKSDGKMPQFAFRGQKYTPNNTPHMLNCNATGNNLNCSQF